jgi:hypothetical protein
VRDLLQAPHRCVIFPLSSGRMLEGVAAVLRLESCEDGFQLAGAFAGVQAAAQFGAKFFDVVFRTLLLFEDGGAHRAGRVGSRIALATGEAGERGSRFCRAPKKSARSCALLTRGKIGGTALRSRVNCPVRAIALPQSGGAFSANAASNARSGLAC